MAETSLVALRDRREQVIALLTQRFSEDTFDVDELDRRLDRAHSAMTLAELDDLVKDLDAPATTALARPDAAAIVRDDPDRPAEKKLYCIFSGVDRKGRWIVPRTLRVKCVFGGGVLDFREADFGPGVTELHVSCVMGGFQVIVPPELAVDVDASAIMGGFDERHRAPRSPDPGRAVLRISGYVVMGGVSIETRLLGESERDARKRERRERKRQRRLARAARGELPPGDED